MTYREALRGGIVPIAGVSPRIVPSAWVRPGIVSSAVLRKAFQG
jgi:hypothetical protein